jgi:hypothetical protein
MIPATEGSLKRKGMSKELYTPSDVKRVRDEMVKTQGGIDPILNEPFKEPPALDHDHTSQHVRAALNRNTNAFEGLVFNAHKRCLKWLTDKPLPEILRNLADYLDQDYSDNPYHPTWIKRCTIDYGRLKAQEQINVLQRMKVTAGGSAAVRKEQFVKAIKTKQYSFDLIKEYLKG